MKAIVIGVFGGPEVLILREVQERSPRNHEVLVRVHATSVNPVDCSGRRGERAVPLPAILGCDVSGVVESIGAEVEDFIPGDEVFYMPETDSGSGSYAEYMWPEPVSWPGSHRNSRTRRRPAFRSPRGRPGRGW